MKHIDNYKLFESKKETDDIIKEVMSKLPKGFYYRVSHKDNSGTRRNISSAIDEYSTITFTIVKLDSKNGALWAFGKQAVKHKDLESFKLSNVESVLDDISDRLENYSVKYPKFYANTSHSTYVSGDKSQIGDRQILMLKFELLLKVPTFKGVAKSEDYSDIEDIFSDVFDGWVPKINIKESGEYYKVATIYDNISPYKIPPMDNQMKNDFFDSISRFESTMKCNLITTSLKYRKVGKRNILQDCNFSIEGRSFTNKESAFDFIRDNDIIEFSIIFKKSI